MLSSKYLHFIKMFGVIFLVLLTSDRTQNVSAANELDMKEFPDLTHNSVDKSSVKAEIKIGELKSSKKLVKRNTDQEDVCHTTACVRAAEDILKKMNKSADPCDNFYEYVCGKFLSETKIPDDKPSLNPLNVLEDNIREQLKEIFEEKSQKNEARPFRMVKELYRTCMDTDKIEEIGLKDLNEVIANIGGWPLLEGDLWDGRNFSWDQAIYKMRDAGFDVIHLFSISLQPDIENTTRQIIQLNEARLSLVKELLVDGTENTFVQALFLYRVDIAVLSGADRARAEEEGLESLKFEIELAKLYSTVEHLDPQLNSWPISRLKDEFAYLRLDEFVMSQHNTIRPEDNVFFGIHPSCFEGLTKLLQTTPKRIIANYLCARMVEACVDFLPANMRKRQREYYKVLPGESAPLPRWRECVLITTEWSVVICFPLAVGSLYVKRYFDQKSKMKAKEMVKNIHKEMYTTLKNVDWLDHETRTLALEKAKEMTFNIGYPDEILDDNTLSDHYSKHNITPGRFLKSALDINKAGTNLYWSRVKEPIGKYRWEHFGSIVTTDSMFYFQLDNSIVATAGILQLPYFWGEIPHYINYGAAGTVCSHLITYAFHDQSLIPDKNGAYRRQVNCLIAQYGNYSVEEIGKKVNGVNTLTGNVADNSGVKHAFLAYRRWADKHGEEKRLPGLEEFTNNQMFWVSFANKFCAKYKPEYLSNMLDYDPFTPEPFRVLGSLSNQKQFSDDFNCPIGAKMNPLEKCLVW